MTQFSIYHLFSWILVHGLPSLLLQVYCHHGCEVMCRLRNLYFLHNNTVTASLSGTTSVNFREHTEHVLGKVTLVLKCSKMLLCTTHVLRKLIVDSTHFPRLIPAVLVYTSDPVCYFVSLMHRYMRRHFSGSAPSRDVI